MDMCRLPVSSPPVNMPAKRRCAIAFWRGRKSWGPMPWCLEMRMCGDSRIEARRSSPPWARRCRERRRAIRIAAGIGIHSEWTPGVLLKEPVVGKGGCSTCLGWRFGMSLQKSCVLLQESAVLTIAVVYRLRDRFRDLLQFLSSPRRIASSSVRSWCQRYCIGVLVVRVRYFASGLSLTCYPARSYALTWCGEQELCGIRELFLTIAT